jgi:nicotinamide-nucleotide adenylyltransferase
MNALFIGRFQPFHLGHLAVIKKAIRENDRLFIGIGSSEANYRPANPFTCSERFQMIEAALDEAKIDRRKYEIVTVRNIDNFALWVRHLALYIPPFSRVYTGSDTVKHLFEAYNLISKKPYGIIDINNIKKELKISGTQIRKSMLKDKKWEGLVPKSVKKLIIGWDGVRRLKAVQESEK